MKRKKQTTPTQPNLDMLAYVKAGRLRYNFGSPSIPGMSTIEAIHHEHYPPIGVVWYTFIDRCTTLIVEWSYVQERFRRCGIRTFLHNALIEAYPNVKRIVTDTGTDTGKAWLLATGFRERNDRFEFIVKRNGRKSR